jgi:glycosyltransferase involved in cell wall biosynthesis
MMMNPDHSIKVSVIMTTYNCEQYVAEAIASILKQSFKDFEFVIVDDGSGDRTFEIISSFQDARIVRLRNKQNLGQTRSLNVGIRHSRGRYIARMDADDVSYPDRLQKQIEFLEKNPMIAMVGSSVIIEQEGWRPRAFRVPTDPIDIKCFLAVSGDLSFWSIAHSTIVIRREVFEESGLYNEDRGASPGYPQDYDLWSKLSRKYLFANISEPLLRYRFLLNSDSRTFADKQLEERWRISYERIKYYFPDEDNGHLTALTNMVEFRPQACSKDGSLVLSLFEDYFQRYMGQSYSNKKAQRTSHLLRFYYIPQLFITNKLLALCVMLKMFVTYPGFLFDVRFYRKCLKVLLFQLVPRKYHLCFITKYLSYR